MYTMSKSTPAGDMQPPPYAMDTPPPYTMHNMPVMVDTSGHDLPCPGPPLRVTAAPSAYNNPVMVDMTGHRAESPELLIRDADNKSEETFGRSFTDKTLRAAFIRKVYAILLLQLLATGGIMALFMFHDGVRSYIETNSFVYISSYVGFIVTYFMLVCCSSLRRSWPWNIILLSTLTLGMALMMGCISIQFDTSMVFTAIGITAIVCLCISLFAIQTKWDVTGLGAYLFVFTVVVLVFGIITLVVAITAGRSETMTMVYAGLIALLFSMYLMYDTQQIIGGRKIELSAEEYIYGALQLYMDICHIFLAVLMLGGRK